MVAVEDKDGVLDKASQNELLMKRRGLINAFGAIIETVNAIFSGYDADEYKLELQKEDICFVPRIRITLGKDVMLRNIGGYDDKTTKYDVERNVRVLRCIDVAFPQYVDGDVRFEYRGYVSVLPKVPPNSVRGRQCLSYFENVNSLREILENILESKADITNRRHAAAVSYLECAKLKRAQGIEKAKSKCAEATEQKKPAPEDEDFGTQLWEQGHDKMRHIMLARRLERLGFTDVAR